MSKGNRSTIFPRDCVHRSRGRNPRRRDSDSRHAAFRRSSLCGRRFGRERGGGLECTRCAAAELHAGADDAAAAGRARSGTAAQSTPELAAVTLALYLAEGALGLPVFAPSLPATLGLAHLLGPTGGYLMAYPAAAALASWLYRRTGPGFGRGFASGLLSAGAALTLVFACGASWLAVWMHSSVQTVLAEAVWPFLPGAGLNIAAAAAVARGFERVRRAR